jgi:integrase
VHHSNPPSRGAKPVPTIKLSDLSIQKLKGSEKHADYFDLTLPTFGLRVSPKGTKTFILKLRNGRQAIGRYPILSLSEARTEAKRILAERTLGRIRPRSITYPQATRLFIEDKKKHRRPNTYEAYEWHLNRLGFSGELSEISNDDVARALARIKSKSTYNHALVAARIFFNWCIKRPYIEHNPTTGLSPHSTLPRARLLTDQEAKLIWQATEEKTHFNTIVRLLLLTGQRRNEIASLKSEYIKDDICTLPSTLTKNGREHSFPLGDLAASMFKSIKMASSGTSLFPARGGSGNCFNGWSKSKAGLDRRLGGTVENWTLHDIRRFYASAMARLGVSTGAQSQGGSGPV